MNKIPNIFTKENYSYLCENRFPLSHKLRKQAFLHIPKEKAFSCENLHKPRDFLEQSRFFQRKHAVFNQVMVSHKQLDAVLKEIGDANTKKKPQPGVIASLNRKKIADIINIYSEVLKINDEKCRKTAKNRENSAVSAENLEISQKISAEMKILREINHKLIEMVSQKTKKMYGREKYNQDKARFLFENSSFFVDLIAQLSKKPQQFKEKTQEKSGKRASSVSFRNISRKSAKTHEFVEISQVFDEFSQNQQEISATNLQVFSRFHENSALNSAFSRKTKQNLTFFESPAEKTKSISTHLPAIFQEKAQISQKSQKLEDLREILKSERADSKKMRSFLRKKQRNFARGLDKISKKIEDFL